MQNPRWLKASLLEYRTQSSGWYICAWFARDSDSAGLSRVFELPMASAGADEPPAVVLQQSQQVAHLHGASLQRAN